jgi:hypothetical protein
MLGVLHQLNVFHPEDLKREISPRWTKLRHNIALLCRYRRGLHSVQPWLKPCRPGQLMELVGRLAVEWDDHGQRQVFSLLFWYGTFRQLLDVRIFTIKTLA